MIALAERLAELDMIHLLSGNHDENDERQMCAMEAVAYVAGETWTDHPACACPVLGQFMRSWNDGLPTDEDRDRLLKPFVEQLIDTKSTPDVESKRGFLALDWLIRVHTPKWLDLVPALAEHAKALRDLEEIADIAGATAAGEKVRAAQAASSAAWDAAWDAARAAAGAAAWDAARAAAGAAAWDAAWDAAWAAAGDAAWAAARAAAGAKLKPTTEWLQASATDLLTRMIAVEPASLRAA